MKEQNVFYINQITIAEEMWNSDCGIEFIKDEEDLYAFVISPEIISKMAMLGSNGVIFKKIWTDHELVEKAVERLKELTNEKEIQYVEIYNTDETYDEASVILNILEYFKESLKVRDDVIIRIKDEPTDHVIEEPSEEHKKHYTDLIEALRNEEQVFIYESDIADIDEDNTSGAFNETLIDGLVMQHFVKVKTKTTIQDIDTNRHIHRVEVRKKVSSSGKELRVRYNAYFKYEADRLISNDLCNYSEDTIEFKQASKSFIEMLDEIAKREIVKVNDTRKILKRATGIFNNCWATSKIYTANSDDIYFKMQKKIIKILRQMWKDKVYLSVNLIEILDKISEENNTQILMNNMEFDSLITFNRNIDIDEYVEKLIKQYS